MLSSWSAVIDYCRTAMAFADKEQFRILFLDKRNELIADEVQQTGTVDHTPVYPREVVKRALELSATAIILVHNHPSGDPTPSRADIQMTQAIIDVAKPARHRRARPHHRRQGRACEPAGDEAHCHIDPRPEDTQPRSGGTIRHPRGVRGRAGAVGRVSRTPCAPARFSPLRP